MILNRTYLLEDPRENATLIENVREAVLSHGLEHVELEIFPQLTGYRTLRVTVSAPGRCLASSFFLRPDDGHAEILKKVERFLARFQRTYAEPGKKFARN